MIFLSKYEVLKMLKKKDNEDVECAVVLVRKDPIKWRVIQDLYGDISKAGLVFTAYAIIKPLIESGKSFNEIMGHMEALYITEQAEKDK